MTTKRATRAGLGHLHRIKAVEARVHAVETRFDNYAVSGFPVAAPLNPAGPRPILGRDQLEMIGDDLEKIRQYMAELVRILGGYRAEAQHLRKANTLLEAKLSEQLNLVSRLSTQIATRPQLHPIGRAG